MSDIVGHPDTQTQLKLLGALYTLLGVGFGLMALIIDHQFLGDGTTAEILSGMISVVLFTFLLFIGPIIAVLTSYGVAHRFAEHPKQAWVTSALGNGGGFIAMVVVAVLFVNSILSGADGGELFNLTDLLVPLVLLAIPTAIVGAGAAYLYHTFP